IGDYNPADDSYTLYTSTQNPHGARSDLAHGVFHLPETKFRVVGPDVGGGFGMKGDTYPEEALVLWASRRCGRPVKWISTRSEGLLGDAHGRDQVVYGEMALDETGKILAIRAQALHAVGAYIAGAGIIPLVFSLRFIPAVYDVQTIFVTTRAVFTNTSPLAPYRGAGRPEASYLTERLLDRAARVIDVDPAEIRRRNFIPPHAMPYATPTGFVYDSGEFGQIMEKCLELADWKGSEARRVASEKKGKLRGRAVTYFIELSHGQGHATTYAQMVSDWLGVPFEDIRFVQGDTDQVSFGRGTYASRSSMLGGCALKAAADAVVEKAKRMAAHLMEAAPVDIEFKEGQFRIVGTDRSMPLVEVAKAFYRPMGLPPEFGVGLEASGSYATEPPNFPNGCNACEVEVDPQTGAVQIDRYIVVDDAGRVINPLICEGQIQGGVAQGIGQALLEEVVYDRESGQLVSGSFTDYCMPRADDLPG
ncbi:MAG: hypothetical protein FD127_4469, partial [Acidimicrobiaceae bacterium]